MPGTHTASVQKVTENSIVSPAGEVQRNVQVQYSVGPHGPFFITMPAASFTAAAAKTAMQSRVDEINALVPETPAK
jgi:hypothetical protein